MEEKRNSRREKKWNEKDIKNPLGITSNYYSNKEGYLFTKHLQCAARQKLRRHTAAIIESVTKTNC